MYHVILAGGSGTRFWPYSRKRKPKQLLKIFSDKSMIQMTLDRILQFSTIEKIYIGLYLQVEMSVYWERMAYYRKYIQALYMKLEEILLHLNIYQKN